MVVEIAAVVGLLLIALCALAWWGARVPVKHRVRGDQAGWVLEVLLIRGYRGAYVIFDVPRTPNLVQVLKYIDARGYGLEFHIPRAAWNATGYSKLLGAIPALGWTTRREAVDKPPDDGVTEFAIVDCGRDISLSVNVLQTLLEFDGISPAADLVARAHNVSPRDEVIDR
jgi:hypothetical protein